MSRIPLPCAFVLCLLGSLGAAPPEDPVGAWKLKCVAPDGKPRQCVITVCREGRSLKGSYTADGETRPVEGIAFEKGELCVRVKGEFAGQAYGLTYRGKPKGEVIKGSVRWSYGLMGGSFGFEGERIGQQVASSR